MTPTNKMVWEQRWTEAVDEIKRLTVENWQLKGALGYEVPGDIPCGDFKCGLCEAKTNELFILRAQIEDIGRVAAKYCLMDPELRRALEGK